MKKRKAPKPAKARLSDVLERPHTRALLENYVDEILSKRLIIEEAQDDIKTLKASACESLNIDSTVLTKFINAVVAGDDGTSAEVAEALVVLGF
jgi:cytochrome P450